MKKITKILILSIFTLIFYGSFVNLALAGVVSTVQFETTPLFSESNFAPGNSITKWIKLNNTTEGVRLGIVRALNVVNEGEMGDLTTIEIKHGDETIYKGTFSDFFSKSEVDLSLVPASSSETFYFVVTFDKNSGNNSQNDTMSFNLQAGFEGDSETDTISIGSSGSYETFGPKALVITNDQAESFLQDETSTIVITWDTNIPATSQVVYGLTSGAPYNLDLLDSNFGYPFSTEEVDLNKVLNHSIILSDLPVGQYSYRVVSRASPPTVGYEKYFTVNSRQQSQNQSNLDNFSGSFSSEVNSGNDLIEEDNLIRQEPILDNNLSASAGRILGLPNVWFFGLVSLLVLLFIFFIIYYRRKKENNNRENNKVK